MPPRKTLTASAFIAHAFKNPDDTETIIADYNELFSKVLESRSDKFTIKFRGETIAIAEIKSSDRFISLLFIRGSETTITTFNEDTGVANDSRLPEGEIAAITAWIIIEKGTRLMFIENKRPGLPASYIERYFQQFARARMDERRFSFELHPVPGPGFQAEIASFTRIRLVEISLSRPNHSWTESAKKLIGDAADSNAGTMQVTAKAETNQSLAKDKGIVYRLREMASNPISALKNARVAGSIPGKDREHVANLKESQVAANAIVDNNASRSQIHSALLGSIDDVAHQVSDSIKKADNDFDLRDD